MSVYSREYKTMDSEDSKHIMDKESSETIKLDKCTVQTLGESGEIELISSCNNASGIAHENEDNCNTGDNENVARSDNDSLSDSENSSISTGAYWSSVSSSEAGDKPAAIYISSCPSSELSEDSDIEEIASTDQMKSSCNENEERIEHITKKQRVHSPQIVTGYVESLTSMTMQNVMETTDNMSGSRRRLKSQKELYVMLVAESMVDNAINNVLESLGMSPPGIRRIVNAGIASAIREQGLCLASDDNTEGELNEGTHESTTVCPDRALMCSRLLNNVSKITLQRKPESIANHKKGEDDTITCLDIKPQPSTSTEMTHTKLTSPPRKPFKCDPKGKRLMSGKKRKFHVHRHQEAIPSKRVKIVALEECSSSSFKTEACLSLHDVNIITTGGGHQSDVATSDLTSENKIAIAEKSLEGCFDSCLQKVEDEALLCAINEQGIFMNT
ncbi:uncharacterized protein LOC144353386 [Saccoglossus kowalevskii]